MRRHNIEALLAEDQAVQLLQVNLRRTTRKLHFYFQTRILLLASDVSLVFDLPFFKLFRPLFLCDDAPDILVEELQVWDAELLDFLDWAGDCCWELEDCDSEQ